MSNMNATKTKLQHQDKKIKVNQINSISVIQANQVYMQCKDHGYNTAATMEQCSSMQVHTQRGNKGQGPSAKAAVKHVDVYENQSQQQIQLVQ